MSSYVHALLPFTVDGGVNITGILVTSFVVLLTYLTVISRRPRGYPPGPPSLPILGSVPFLKHGANNFYKEFTRLGQIYGDVFSMALGHTWVVVLNDFSAIKEAFVTRGIEFAGRIDDPRDGIVHRHLPVKGIIDGQYTPEWTRQRNNALSLLRTLGWGKRGVEERIMEERNTLLNEMAAIDGKPVNPGTMINTSVANVICSLLYGEGYDHDDKDFQELIEAVDNTVGDALSNSALDFIPIKQFFPGYRASLNKWKQSVNKLHEYLEKQIAIRRERRKKSSEEVPGDFVESYLKELDAADSRITQDWLEDITLELFIAGTETTTTTLKWSLLYLVLSPDVQKKVQEELDAVLGQPTGSGVSKLSDRADLPYTEATIMEIQRMSAIVATALVHCTTTDVEFRGWKLPKNTQIRVNLHGVLHDPAYWSDPEVFRPERFLDADGKVCKNERLVPFGMGRRVCLGEQLARQELFLFFTGIIHSFRITLPEGATVPSTEPIGGVILKCQPYQICLQPRF